VNKEQTNENGKSQASWLTNEPNKTLFVNACMCMCVYLNRKKKICAVIYRIEIRINAF
jgi:hypothetical protein